MPQILDELMGQEFVDQWLPYVPKKFTVARRVFVLVRDACGNPRDWQEMENIRLVWIGQRFCPLEACEHGDFRLSVPFPKKVPSDPREYVRTILYNGKNYLRMTLLDHLEKVHEMGKWIEQQGGWA